MADNINPASLLREGAEKALSQTAAQTRGMLDTYFNTLKTAVESFPTGESVVGRKLKSHTKQNIDATQEYMNHLSQAKDFQEIILIQTEFLQKQMQAFVAQAQSVGEAMTKAAAVPMKLPFGKD
jgi:hypothetical protein